MCNATDLATECVNPHETRAFAERILLYDRHPGGIGIAAQVNASDLVTNFWLPGQLSCKFCSSVNNINAWELSFQSQGRRDAPCKLMYFSFHEKSSQTYNKKCTKKECEEWQKDSSRYDIGIQMRLVRYVSSHIMVHTHNLWLWVIYQVQLLFRELLTAALELISTCGCTSTSGCPNCIQVSTDFCVAVRFFPCKKFNVFTKTILLQVFSCGEYNEVIHKDAAVLILKVCAFRFVYNLQYIYICNLSKRFICAERHRSWNSLLWRQTSFLVFFSFWKHQSNLVGVFSNNFRERSNA